MSRTIFRGAKRRGRRIPRSGVRQFVAGHFVAVIGSRIFSRENTTATPTLYGWAEIYRESRTLSIGHSVAGKCGRKKNGGERNDLPTVALSRTVDHGQENK